MSTASRQSAAFCPGSLITLVLVCAISSCAQEDHASDDRPNLGQPLPYINAVEQVQFRHIDEVRAAYPAADDWVVHEFEEHSYVFCIDRLMSMGVSRRCLRGWKFSEALNGWRHVVTVHTRGFMSADIVFQESGSQCVVLGRGNNRLKGEDCIVVDLRVL